MRSKIASLHPLLILLAVALASVLFVVACGDDEPTAVPDTGAAEAAAEAAAVAAAAEVAEAAAQLVAAAAAEAAAVAQLVEASEGIVTQAEVVEEAALPGEAKSGGTLRFVFPLSQVSLDPALSGIQTDQAITQSAYDNLLMIQPDFTVKPELATSWEANEDLSSYTFHLRKGVKFHHGKEFKAEDVLFTFNRLLDSPARSTYEGVVEDIVALDDYTVRFDLVRPNAFFLDTLSIYQARIIPSDVDVNRLAREEFGTGPFIIEEHFVGERTTMLRNPDYWDEGKPYLDELVIMHIPEVATRAEMLKSGDADLVYQLEPQSIDAIDAHPDTVVLNRPSASWIGMYMQTDTPPYDNKLVRQAMQAATDRVGINQAALLGLGEIAYDHPVPPYDPRFAPQHKPPDFDPDLARSLLEQAGYPDGIDITLYTAEVGTGMIEMAVAFKESAEAAGIRVDIERTSSDFFIDNVWNKKPFAVTQWFGLPNPDQAMSIQLMSGVPWNAAHYANPVLDELIIKARGQDLEGQKETYAEIQRILIEDVPRIVVAYTPWLYGARSNVRGVSPHPMGWPLVNDAWFEE